MFTKIKHHYVLALATICFIGFVFNFNTLNEFPQYKHCWAQADRYALSVGFVNNGGDFFHPETYILNNQFPGDFEIPRETSITSVDFPIHDYIVSLIMRLFNTTNPWCFRLYVLLYGIIGLFYLYKLTYLFTSNVLKSLIVTVFAAFSPTLIYYQSGFLPSVPSLANAIIALYFLFKYYKTYCKRDFWLFVLFITLAILARLPFVMLLLAISGQDVLKSIRYRKINYLHWIGYATSLLCVLLYYFYNLHLRNQFGSLFLNSLMPANNFSELVEFTEAVFERWFFKYFTGYHYLLLLAFIVLFVYNRFVLKTKFILEDTKSLMVIALILFCGCLLYYRAMTFQFLDHDYYVLDTFYLPIVLLFLFLVANSPDIQSNNAKKYLAFSPFILLLLSATSAQQVQTETRKMLPPTNSATNFLDSDKFLDSLGVPSKAKILVIAADGPNNPFLLMKRKGYAIVYAWPEKITKSLNWPFDYAVIENNKYQTDVYGAYPDIINKLKMIATNGRISLFVKNTNSVSQSLADALGLQSKKITYSTATNFDTITIGFTNAEQLLDFDGKKRCAVLPTIEWGLACDINNNQLFANKPTTLFCSLNVFSKEQAKDLLICVSVKHKEKDVLFQAQDLAQQLDLNKWNKKQLVFNLPQITEPEFSVKVFIWNKGKNKAYLDDVEIKLFE